MCQRHRQFRAAFAFLEKRGTELAGMFCEAVQGSLLETILAASLLERLHEVANAEVTFLQFLKATNFSDHQQEFWERGLSQLQRLKVAVAPEHAAKARRLQKVVTLKDLPKVEQYTAFVLSRFTSAASNETQEDLDKTHILPFSYRLITFLVVCLTCVLAAGAGALAAFVNFNVNEEVATQVGSDSSAAYYAVTIALSIFWSILEISLIYIFAILATTKTMWLFGMNLFPSDKERVLISGALFRAALDLGQPLGRQMGVDPLKTASPALLCIAGLMLSSKRAILKWLLKFLITRLAPRMAVKAARDADLYIQIGVNAATSLLTTWLAMREVHFICMGPSAFLEYFHMLLEWRAAASADKPESAELDDHTKMAVMRVLGLAVTNKEVMHPNMRFALGHLHRLWVDDAFLERMGAEVEQEKSWTPKSLERAASALARKLRGGLASDEGSSPKTHLETMNERLAPLRLDDASFFWEKHPELLPLDRTLVALVGVLASSLDGRTSYKHLCFMKALASGCDPPRILDCWQLARVRRTFTAGLSLQLEDFLATLEGRGDGQWVPPWYWEFWLLLAHRCSQCFQKTPAPPEQRAGSDV